MDVKVIQHKDIASFIEAMLREYEVFAPVKRDAITCFEEIQSVDEVFLGYTNSVRPPKSAILPQAETLLRYSPDDESSEVAVPLEKRKPKLLFGLRPCDARGLLFLDKVFNDADYHDPYYLNRREGMVVISLGCSKPRKTCFCTWVGGSPFSTDGSDLMLVDIGDEYAVQVITGKGEKLLLKGDFKDATEGQLSRMREVISSAEESMKTGLQAQGLKKKLDALFDDPMWDEISEKCLGCGICTFLCPTCHCFDIVDEVGKERGERIRIWDSCQFSQFTLQASGVNPRPSGKERYRQRILHKFRYSLDNQGELGCVGCGRCVSNCPVNLDIRQVLMAIERK